MSRLKTILMVLAGNVLLAMSVAFLIIPNNILTGGVAGMSVALYPLTRIPVVYMTNILVIGLYLVGVVLLGKAFAMRTLLSAVFYPILLSVFTWIAAHDFPPDYFVMEPWIASAYGGALAGAGLGIVFRTGSSTGGMDIPALVMAKYLPISSANAVLVVDGCTVLLGIYTYGLEAALIGLISVFVCSWVIDKILLLGSQSAENVFIVSDKFMEIEEFLLKDVSRGVTELAGRGGYTGEDKPILMCCISRSQYPALEEGVLKIDPSAFIIVNNVHSVHGEGFERLPHSTI